MAMGSQTIRVMIVDDHAMVCAGMKILLEQFEGIQVIGEAANGCQAIELVERLNPDVILMDLHMPVMDGIEATRIIRSSDNPRINNIPIVALTAAIMSENHDKIDKLNINDYVLKPFKPHDLFERIRKHIR
jgi:CheY-like chemotaxis protein